MSETELLEPTNDYVFHRVFGNPKRPGALIGLLNALFMNKPLVQDVQIKERDLKADVLGGKEIILDLNLSLDDETKINVEMQCRRYEL